MKSVWDQRGKKQKQDSVGKKQTWVRSLTRTQRSRTLFMENLAMTLDTPDLHDFFGSDSIEEIHLEHFDDWTFKGSGYITFVTSKAAKRALKLNSRRLLGHKVKLDLVRKRGKYTRATGNGNSHQVTGKAASNNSDKSDSDSEDDEEPKSKVPLEKVPAAAVANNSSVAAKKKVVSCDDSDSDESSFGYDVPSEVVPQAKKATAKKNGSDALITKKKDSSESSESEKPKVAKAQKEDSSSREDSSEEETSEFEEEAKISAKTPKKKDADVEMVEADSGKTDIKKAALQLNSQPLLGCEVKLDLARKRGKYTRATGNGNSHQRSGRAQPQGTIFLRGFDTSGGEEQVRSALQEHFGSCGDISRESIPKDYKGGLKGIAFMDFKNSDGLYNALELDGSELRDGTLIVEEAKPRYNSLGSGGSGTGRGWSNGGGRFDGGRSGGRFGGGRSGGWFGGAGSIRLSMATPGTGRKTTFDD